MQGKFNVITLCGSTRFRAEYESGEIKVQPEEISEAKWFKKDQLPSIPPAGSVAHNLITGVFD